MISKQRRGGIDPGTQDAVMVRVATGRQGGPQGLRCGRRKGCQSPVSALLDELEKELPDVGACLKDGLWTGEAENVLLEKHSG